MLPQKPYLVRAFYEWIIDSDCTPYLLVDATVPGTQVPQDYVEDGEIVLDISTSAVANLKIGNHKIEFQATFAGILNLISVPFNAVLAIYANENGRGMVFNLDEEDAGEEPSPEGGAKGGDSKKGSHLTLIK